MDKNTATIIYATAILVFTAYLMVNISAWWFIGGVLLLSSISSE